MKVIPKLQQGNTIESDNTKVVRPEIHEPIKAKPKQYSIVDLGGEPSNDTRSAAERNRDYWHPIKGAKARFRASMSNETNPLVRIERTILPSAAGAALVTTPAAVVGGALGNMTVDKLTGGWGNWLEDKTGIPSEIRVYTNPGAWYGGAKGYKIGKDKLITKSIKGDADLAWNPINKNHWIFNKEARTPSNIAMATANRITPFLSKVEKLPLKVAAYKAAKRTNGNASVSLQDIKTMPADYTGSSILGGGNLEGRNLLAKYIFDENPVIKRIFFNKATSNIKPISRNEARRGFSHGDRYEQLYPGIYNRRYEMSAVVPSGRPLKFQEASEFTEYAGKNPIGKIIGKEAEPVMRMGDKEFMTFRQPGTDYIGPIDDVAGHLVKFQMNKGKLRQTSQDMWKFNPADYAKKWNDSPNTANQVRLTKQAALMDKVGRPFILQQSNPIWIEGKSVRNPELVTMAHGGRFDFKKSPLLKKQEEINGKRDVRKKFIKSSRPTYKKRIKKAQQGMKFVSYNPVSNPTIDYTDITNPINPFSEYNFNTVYDKPEALVVPVRDTNEPDVVANNPIAEPVINKPVASKSVTDKPVTKTANSTWKSPYTNRKQWSTELINAYKKAGITNDNAIRMLLAQDALESSWGKSAQGKYNFGNLTTGSSWKGDYVTGNDKNAKGEAIKQKFRSYNSMDEYAADKVQFLKRLYDFDENDDINKFVAKLTGSNKGKRRYAEAKEYANSLRGVYNSFKAGGIIKYQNPSSGIKYIGGYDKRGNIVLPVNNENGMNNVTLPEVTVTPRNINLAGAVDRGKRKFLKTTGELATPVLAGAGIAGLGYGLATATIPTLISLGTSYVGTKVGESIDDKTDNNTNYKTMGGLIGGAVGGLGANMTPRLIAGDAYTTVGGKFGYYGNPLQRFTGTVGRRLNLNTKARNPELLRKISEPAPINSNGTIQVSNPTPRADFARTNFTTDRPVVSHSEKNNWDHMDLMIFDPKITKGLKPASVEPSDTFYPFANITAKPSQTTLVSGNKSALINAQDKGMSTLSSPKLRQIYKDMQAEYLGNLTRYSRMTPLQRRLAKTGFKDNVSPASKKAYAEEIQKLQSKRGTPTIKDYRKIEEDTGLDAGVVDIKDLNPELVDKIANSKGYFTYPNGEVTSSYHYPQAYSDKAVLNRMPYNKVFYDPASPVEEQWAIKNGFLK